MCIYKCSLFKFGWMRRSYAFPKSIHISHAINAPAPLNDVPSWHHLSSNAEKLIFIRCTTVRQPAFWGGRENIK